MILSPKVGANRPRLACEIAVGGVVAARSTAPGGPLTAVARVELAEGAIFPGLKPGNVADRVATIAAVRRALEGVGARSNARNSDLTLVIPDGAVRVLLLDFDSLPGKLTEALPLVRFRLKRLVPFDTDHAMVSFQVMSSSRSAVRVLAVAIPRDVLTDYETVVREAGFEPGAVLPSTLAALAGLAESEIGQLTVNVYPSAVTTAIVRGGTLLLHRTVELTEHADPTPAGVAAALFEPSPPMEERRVAHRGELLPLVDAQETAEEWAAQEPLPEFGREPYANTSLPEPWQTYVAEPEPGRLGELTEAAPVGRSPYAAPGMSDDLQAEIHNSFLTSAPPVPAFQDRGAGDERRSLGEIPLSGRYAPEAAPVHTLAPDARAEEIARAVSVAVAYFEDLLSASPEILLSAGSLGSEELNRTLAEQGLTGEMGDTGEMGLRSREMVDGAALAVEATSAPVPRGLLAGVAGALGG